MPVSVITAKGQTTIPKKIRKHLNIQPGDKVDFVIEKSGKAVLEPATLDVRALEGILHNSLISCSLNRRASSPIPDSELPTPNCF